MAVNTYKTKQREIILNYLKSNKDKHLTIEDVSNHLKQQNEQVGQTTIYRYINILVNDGLVRKYIIDLGQPACFQYIENTKECESHYHLKCNNCGDILHISCRVFKDIENHLNEEHKFKIDNSKLILYGTCDKCNE